MTVDEYVHLLAGGDVSPIHFERMVLRLLNRHLEINGRALLTAPGVDGFAPNGVAALKGDDGQVGEVWSLDAIPTIIEVKYRLRPSDTKLAHRLQSAADAQRATGVLIIVGSAPSDQTMRQSLPQALSVQIWDLNQIKRLLDAYVDSVVDLVPELREEAVRRVVEKSKSVPTDWKKTNQQNLRDLKQAYLRNDLTLFCGAGISIAAGVPSWNTLVSRLMTTLLDADVSVTSEEELGLLTKGFLTAYGSSPLLTARYIRKGLGQDFRQHVANSIYRSPIDSNCRILQQLAQLCTPRRNGPGVRSVITFNFDSLLEDVLRDRGVLTRSIYRDAIVPSPDELPIYHVHGFLPRDADNYEGVRDSALIFSEEEYHQIFRDAYSWSNIVQLNHLRETTCLLVGLSLTDPNLRRLLDIAANQNSAVRHYVIFQRTAAKGLVDAPSTLPKHVMDQALNFHHEMMTNTLASLGLNVIWYESYDEIPEMLQVISR